MPTTSTSIQSIAKASAPVWVLVLGGVMLEFWDVRGGVSAHARAAILIGLGLAATGVVAWVQRSRARRLARVEEIAASILAFGLPKPGERTSAAMVLPLEGDAGEFEPLQRALDELGHRLEQHLKELAKKTRNLEALIDAMDEPLLATDNEDRVMLCNRSAEAIFEAGPGELVGRLAADLLVQSELRAMYEAARTGQVRRGRVRATTTLGKRTYQVSALPVPVAWGEGIFGAVIVLRDVTELDQAVQIKTDFVANASHELRTPVAAIRGAAETLQDAVREDAAMAQRLSKMVLTHSERLEELLRDLLDLSRLETPDAPRQVETIDFSAISRSLLAMSEPICAERQLELELEWDPDLAGMRTDPKVLMLILRNLVENATKYAYQGTTVRVVGSALELDVPGAAALPAGAGEQTGGAPALSLPGAAPAHGATRGVVRFEVIDRGIGVPLNAQERVFERFYQVDPARSGLGAVRRGTGLGLAIVKHAAKSLGGHCGLNSVWGEGTTAWVEVPVTFAAQPPPPPSAAAEAPVQRSA